MSKDDSKLIIGVVGIEMSWVEKNRKIHNRGNGGGGWGVGCDYSGLESIQKLTMWDCGARVNLSLKSVS